ncbi:hypothetical protein [Oricola thermophila]|uniref:PepSY domain-containing protein n=1 Tax=Oricola thermophila TaxID=2742145 RepID=A0A6N1VMC5_9HYPH|nr:hypothetical protein [Oricola thermophila]QKV20359.1 hypothetical protein HTY61_18845 [Oricola thermophila]
MKNVIATAAFAALFSAGTVSATSAMPVAATVATPANGVQANLVAQHDRGYIRHQRRILPRRAVIKSLHRKGYRNIRNIRMRHGDYVLHATSRRGPVRLVVDGRTARVLSRKPLFHTRHRPGVTFHGRTGGFSYHFGIH